MFSHEELVPDQNHKAVRRDSQVDSSALGAPVAPATSHRAPTVPLIPSTPCLAGPLLLRAPAHPVPRRDPSQLGRLTAFTEGFQFSVSGTDGSPTDLSGTIPTELGQITLLEKYFEIFSHKLTGSLPTQLGGLSALEAHFNLKST